jgi:CheY-like chemotaxis protein
MSQRRKALEVNFTTDGRRSDIVLETPMGPIIEECILIVDSNPVFCARLAQECRVANYSVLTAHTGERAFLILRHRQHRIGWLYCRATLPGLIDGWILADQYHDAYPSRPVVIAAHTTRFSARGDIVLNEPTVTVVSETIRHVIQGTQPARSAAPPGFSEHRRAA